MYGSYVKPVMDFTVAAVLLVVLSPLILLGLGLALYSFRSFPVFTHERPGLNEKSFRLLKIRTMLPEHDAEGRVLDNLQRVTPIGHFLRNTSIDELPQLINVLKGELSLVGPRPLEMRYLPYYTQAQRRRHSVKPGITGLAQVNGRNRLTWDQKFQLDLEYIDNLSLLMDLRILLKTVTRIVRTGDVNAGSTRTVEAFVEKPAKPPESTCNSDQKSVSH